MPEKIAIFDIDHTLIKRASGEYFIREACKRRVIPLSILLAVPCLYFKYHFQNVHWDTWQHAVPGFAGVSEQTFSDIAVCSFERREHAALFPEMERRIAALRGQRIPVWLATSSIDFMVRPIAEYLRADRLIASSIEFTDGLSTGRFAGKPVFGREKLNRVRAQVSASGADLADCSFYSDSFHDLPLLEAAGFPFAVNPDFRLAKIAKARGWEIVRC